VAEGVDFLGGTGGLGGCLGGAIMVRRDMFRGVLGELIEEEKLMDSLRINEGKGSGEKDKFDCVPR
jgi:hypothetical protein